MTAMKSPPSKTAAPQIFEYAYYQKLYDIEESHWWSKGMRAAMDVLLDRALAFAPLKGRRDLDILDAGCGTGYLLTYLRRYSDREVVGYDNSDHALKFCQQRGFSRLVLASAVDQPFAPDSFDIILCNDTLQHLSPIGGDQSAMNAFAKMLRSGGLLFIRTNSALGHAPLEGADENLYRRYHRRDLIRMSEAAGLRVERASYVNMLPSVWAMAGEYTRAFTAKRAQQSKAIGPGLAIRPPQPGVISAVLHGWLKVEAAVIGLGVDLPFGHSQILLARKP